MATYIGNQTTFWVTNGPNGETYILDVNQTVAVADNFGLATSPPYSGMTLQVLGRVTVTGMNRVAVLDTALDSKIEIGATGQLFGGMGAWFQAATVNFTNDGYINADNSGVVTNGGAGTIVNNGEIVAVTTGINNAQYAGNTHGGAIAITNAGSINAAYGIVSGSDETTIDLSAGSVIRATAIGIDITSGVGSVLDVDVAGSIVIHNGVAYRGSDGGADTLTNSGRITGSVQLRGGDDTYIDKKGAVDGYIYGGFGDDTYMVASKGLTILEYSGQGEDAVKSSVSFSLVGTGEIETLLLTGKKNIRGEGNEFANSLTGNKGNNTLDAGTGDDVLAGGKGRDIFVFKQGGGSDTIRDFRQVQDRIDLTDYDAIGKFKHLEISQSGSDVVIDLSAHEVDDMITILNARLTDFDKGDFIFG